jgi:hypothetical protein
MKHAHLTRVTPLDIFMMFSLWNIKYGWPSVYDRGGTVKKRIGVK